MYTKTQVYNPTEWYDIDKELTFWYNSEVWCQYCFIVDIDTYRKQ